MHNADTRTTEELTVVLIQLAKGHQHKQLDTLLEEAKSHHPMVTEEQWERATIRFAHAYFGEQHDPDCAY